MEMDIEREIERQPQKRKKSPEIYQPRSPRPAGYFSERITLANQTCWIMGILLFALGSVGYAVTNQRVDTFLGFHLSYLNNLMNTAVGILTFVVGFSKKGPIAKKYCLWIGSFYFLLAATGFIFGQHQIVSGEVQVRYLLTLIPEYWAYGRWDHLLHAGIGFILILAGFFSKSKRVMT